MTTFKKAGVSLYVDKSGRQWIVRDPDGKYWALPPGDDPWENRRPFDPTGEADLEPMPGHYKYMLGISP